VKRFHMILLIVTKTHSCRKVEWSLNADCMGSRRRARCDAGARRCLAHQAKSAPIATVGVDGALEDVEEKEKDRKEEKEAVEKAEDDVRDVGRDEMSSSSTPRCRSPASDSDSNFFIADDCNFSSCASLPRSAVTLS
jgi:hypothetical protein